jgi:hypothetical protein
MESILNIWENDGFSKRNLHNRVSECVSEWVNGRMSQLVISSVPKFSSYKIHNINTLSPAVYNTQMLTNKQSNTANYKYLIIILLLVHRQHVSASYVLYIIKST